MDTSILSSIKNPNEKKDNGLTYEQVRALLGYKFYKLEDGEYKVSLINESDGIHNHTILPFTKKSYDLKGKTSIFTKTKGKYGYTRYVRTEDKAKVFPGDSDIYVPFAPNWIVKGDIINDKGVLKFDFIELLTIKGYNNMTHEDE